MKAQARSTGQLIGTVLLRNGYRLHRAEQHTLFALEALLLIDDRKAVAFLRNGVNRALGDGRAAVVLRATFAVYFHGYLLLFGLQPGLASPMYGLIPPGADAAHVADVGVAHGNELAARHGGTGAAQAVDNDFRVFIGDSVGNLLL